MRYFCDMIFIMCVLLYLADLRDYSSMGKVPPMFFHLVDRERKEKDDQAMFCYSILCSFLNPTRCREIRVPKHIMLIQRPNEISKRHK